jgi:hypothetical protein
MHVTYACTYICSTSWVEFILRKVNDRFMNAHNNSENLEAENM